MAIITEEKLKKKEMNASAQNSESGFPFRNGTIVRIRNDTANIE